MRTIVYSLPGSAQVVRLTGMFVLTLFMLISVELFAQGYPSAKLDDSGVIALPEGEVQAVYLFEVPGITGSDADFNAMMAGRSTGDFIIRPFTSERKGILTLQLSKHPEWTLQNWNDALRTAFSANPIGL